MPLDPKLDFKAFTCASMKWDRMGAPAPPSPNGLWTASPSSRFCNSGRRNWPVIEKNKPVSQSAWASAGPAGSTPGSGSTAIAQDFSFDAKNCYGATVVSLRFRLEVQAGATGKTDRWIAQFSVAPGELNVASGWEVSMTVLVQEPCEFVDAGVTIAVLPVRIALAIQTKLKSQDASDTYFVTPIGLFEA